MKIDKYFLKLILILVVVSYIMISFSNCLERKKEIKKKERKIASPTFLIVGKLKDDKLIKLRKGLKTRTNNLLDENKTGDVAFQVNNKKYISLRKEGEKRKVYRIFDEKEVKSDQLDKYQVIKIGYPPQDLQDKFLLIGQDIVKVLNQDPQPKYLLKINDIYKGNDEQNPNEKEKSIEKKLIYLLPFNQGIPLGHAKKELFSQYSKDQMNCILSSLILGGLELAERKIIHNVLDPYNFYLMNVKDACPKILIINLDDKITLDKLDKKEDSSKFISKDLFGVVSNIKTLIELNGNKIKIDDFSRIENQKSIIDVAKEMNNILGGAVQSYDLQTYKRIVK